MTAIECSVPEWDGENSTLLAQAPASVAKVCYEYEHAIWPFYTSKKCIKQVKKFQLRPDDVFIVTFPKSGTTWVQHIMLLIQYDADLSAFKDNHIFTMVPYLDRIELKALNNIVHRMKLNQEMPTVAEIERLPTMVEAATAMPSYTTRILKTHMAPRWIPERLRDDPKAKVLYVARNPKDTAVSYFNYCQLMKTHPDYTSWDEFIEEFISERVPNGSYYDSVLYWWKLRNHPNVLFLKYEDMKQDARKAVVQIAEFMGKSFSDEAIDQIVETSSFSFMKKNKSTNPDEVISQLLTTGKNRTTTFMRKGIVGDWKNYFSEDQNRRFDKIYQQKIRGSGLEFRFE